MSSLRRVQQEALARRMEGQPDAVRALLQAKLEATPLPPTEPPPAPVRRRPAPSALASLVPGPRAELSSVKRFRRTWSAARAEERLLQSTSRGPANAGPLNSHMLVLQSLELMRGLPAAYLRHFVPHVESLLWLESIAPPPRKRR